VVVIASGCAPRAPAVNPNLAQVTKLELKQIKRQASQVAPLQAQLKTLQKRLQHVEQRVGLAAFTPTQLKRMRSSESKLIKPLATQVRAFGRSGKKLNLDRYLKGFDGAVIAYWATWCKPCTTSEELAHLKNLQKQLRRHNIELISIVIDSLKKAQADRRAPNWLYPFWFKQDAHIEMLSRPFIERVGMGLPLFLVLSRTGEVRYFLNNKLSDSAVRDIVTATANVCRI
jgi:thiol-disulfide isomerase/thioredoxin